MGRIVAFLLGGLALALYGPYMFMSESQLAEYVGWWKEKVGTGWYDKAFTYGPGIFAGIALLLLAVRGRDGGDGGTSYKA